VGCAVGDIPDLVEGSLMQQRLLATSPKPVTAEDLSGIFERSMRLW
jgi:alcohol dehydrogenase class IV